MRSVFTIFFLLLFSISYGQNYSLFQPNVVPYFTSQHHHLKGIRVDSVKIINNETHYFLYHTPRGNWGSSSFHILDTNGGSWVGQEVVERQNGVMIIPNLWNDTVFINTQTNLNDIWRFYDDSSQNYYEATVTGYDTATISGAFDSLKIITISAYNSLGINTTDSIHGKQIVLSKNHGLFQTFALHSFPFPKTAFNTMGMDYYMDKTEKVNNVIQMFSRIEKTTNPTTFELYDYQPGDILQYRGSLVYVQDYTKEDSVVSRNLISTSQLQYVFRTKIKSINGPNVSTNNYYDTVIIDYAVLKWLDSTLMPDESGSTNFVVYNAFDTTYCLKTPMYYTTYNHIGGDILNQFEITHINRINKVGIGLTSNYISSGSYPNNNRDIDLVYTMKSGISCGSRLILPVKDALITENLIAIYPNPTKEKLYIQTALNNYQLSVYNLLGSEAISKNNVSKNTELDVRDLVDGVYFLNIYSKEADGFITKKFVVQH